MKNKHFLMPIMAILIVFFMIGCPESASDNVAVSSVTINEAAASPYTINVGGDDITLHATVLPGNASNKTVTWTSSAPTIASIGATTGTVTALATGTANITASAGGKTSEVFVVNVLVPVTSVTINEMSQSPKALLVGGTGITLTATVAPPGASNSTVTWTSSAPAIASVNSATGAVTALAAGTADIFASAGGIRSTAFVVNTSVIAVESVTINEMSQSPKTLRVGEAGITLTATVLPENASFKTVTWTSSATTKASVNATTGAVTAVAQGDATITATAGGVASTTAFAVTILPPYISSISITNDSPMLDVGETDTMTFRILPTGVPVQTVKWSSSAPEIATIDENTGVITAVAKGTTTITVTSDATDANGATKTGTLDVKVVVWDTLFFWDADTDAGLATIGEPLPEGELFDAVPSTVGAKRLFSYGGKDDWILQNYLWTGSIDATGFSASNPGPMVKVDKNSSQDTGTLDGTQSTCVLEKAGYFLDEGVSPCLQIGSSARGRTTSGALPTGNEGQLDLSNKIFRVKLEYTPLVFTSGTANIMYGTIYNAGATNITATPWPGRISAGGGTEYVEFTTLNMGQKYVFNTGALDTTSLGETTNAFLATGFITVRAAVSGTKLVLHSVKIDVLAAD